MSGKLKKVIALLLCTIMTMGTSTAVFAAEEEEAIVIDLFDVNSPYLIEVVEVQEKERTTSPPTEVWNIGTQGSYSYSAYSNNNTMWTKYIFFDPSNLGEFKVTAKSNNTNYRMLFINTFNNRRYTYSIPSTNVMWKTQTFDQWNNADEFYFGVDTSATGGAVSVEGVVSY